MTRGERAILLNAGSLTGILVLLFGAILWFPATYQELTRVREIQGRLTTQFSLDAEAKSISEQIHARVQTVKDRLESREKQLEVASFSLLPASNISATVEKLADQFTESGVSITNMSYKSRITEEGLVTLPFEILIESDYPSFRKLLHLVETHTAHLFLDRLEFVSLDNDRHRLQARLACLIRFKQ